MAKERRYVWVFQWFMNALNLLFAAGKMLEHKKNAEIVWLGEKVCVCVCVNMFVGKRKEREQG